MAQLEPTPDHHQSNNNITSVDDFYFSALFDEPPTDVFPISDSKYAEELQFQEALMSSSKANPQTTTTTAVASSSSSSLLLSSSSPPEILVQILVPFVGDEEECSLKTLGESSQMFCEICAERKPVDQKFTCGDTSASECKHSFCSGCITTYIGTKLRDNSINGEVIPCPGQDCKDIHFIGIESCRQVLPKEVVERWDEALCEALVMAWRRFYCPFKDCSAVMVREEDEEVVIAEAECPVCHRLFCARCGVGPFHAGIGCEEFGGLREDERGREDLMVRELAKEKKWRRCPRCSFYVERTEGCLHITCRCAFQFCYACGDGWTQTHGGCQRD